MMKWKILWQIERFLMWVDADLHPMREKVYFTVMLAVASLLLAHSLCLMWVAFSHPPNVDLVTEFEAIFLITAGRVFALLAILFRLPGDDPRGDRPVPAPWPQTPEVIVIEWKERIEV